MKKLISLVLAMLMLAMPTLADGVIGGADGPTAILLAESLPADIMQRALDAGRRIQTNATLAIAGLETGDAQVDAALADFFRAVGLTWGQQGDEIDLSVQLSGNDVFTFGTITSGDDLYLQSNLLRGTVVIGSSEVEGLILRAIDLFTQMGVYTEEDAASIKAQLPMMLEMIASVSGNAVALTPEDLLTLDYSSLVTPIVSLAEKMQPVDTIVVPRNCDAAASGLTITIQPDDMRALTKGLLLFIRNNEKLLNYWSSASGYVTEEQREAMWALYKDTGVLNTGLYEDYEEFVAYNPTFVEFLDEALAELDTADMGFSEIVGTVYSDEEGLPVYAVVTLKENAPSLFAAEGSTISREVGVATYSRQHVAEGVSHVINITADDETVTLDVLTKDDAFTATLADSEGAMVMTLNGAWAISDTAIKLDFVLDMAITDEGYSYGSVVVEPSTTHITMSYNADSAINGVDFVTDEAFSIQVEGVTITVNGVTTTMEPRPSIMAGEVVRPAELEDTAFSDWLVGIVNDLGAWLGTVMMNLPESVLELLVQLGL